MNQKRRRRARDEGVDAQVVRELQRPEMPPRPRRAVERKRACVEINQ